MANLGSENTPIEGESFGLPSGYSFDEENGDLVIRDTDGTVAMRRADGTWELESDLALNENDISGVGAFDSESVNTERLERTDTLIDQSSQFGQWGFGLLDDPDDTSSGTFETIGNFVGAGPHLDRKPAGATLYANLLVQASSVPDGETGTYRANILSAEDGDNSSDNLTEHEVEVTDSSQTTSGWKEVERNFNETEVMAGRQLQAKVTGGTLETSGRGRFGLAFEWRVE